MTYHWNIASTRSLLDEDVLDESPQDLIRAPKIGAHDGARDDHHDRALQHLVAVRPLDLAELAVGLADERAAPAADVRLGMRFDRSGGGHGRAGDARTRALRRCRIAARRAAGVAALPTGLSGHGLPGLPVERVRRAPPTVLAELDPVGRVSLRLLRLVVAPLALGASERDRDSDSGCHCAVGALLCSAAGRRCE